MKKCEKEEYVINIKNLSGFEKMLKSENMEQKFTLLLLLLKISMNVGIRVTNSIRENKSLKLQFLWFTSHFYTSHFVSEFGKKEKTVVCDFQLSGTSEDECILINK